MNKPAVKKNQFQLIASNLKVLLEKKDQAIPKDLNQARFLENCMTVLIETRDIEKCDPGSVARTCLKGALLGLDFSRKECYAIPYAGKLNFQTDYKGEIKLAKKYSTQGIKDIYAKCVRQGDEFFSGIVEGKQVINFKPQAFNNGEIVGVFAVVLFNDGSMLYETMSVDQVNDVKNHYSKQANVGMWKHSWDQAAQKTVIRRLLKLVTLDFENPEQQKAFNEGGDMREDIETEPQIDDPFSDELSAPKRVEMEEAAVTDAAESPGTAQGRSAWEIEEEVAGKLPEEREGKK